MKQSVIAKITRPDTRRVSPRERLFRLFDKSWDKLLWVAGPAGSGKTSLAASYLAERKLPCIWYNVDEGDTDIATFFYYMGLAAKKAFPRSRKSLPFLTPEYLPGISTFTLGYFETLYSRMKVPYVLVIDNCHHVPAESMFHEVIAAGVSIIPEGIKVLLISRSEPAAGYSRLRANGGMVFVGWDDLRFTAEESRAMIGLRTPEIRSKDMVQRVQKIAEGWAAGLVLISESVKRGTDPQFHEKSAPEEIIDYFGSELFGKTDEETRNFLMKTAQLPWITASIAEELTGSANGGAVLSSLRRSNYFLERQLAAEPVYRYHPLFRGFLLARAKEAFSREEINDIGLRAAHLFEKSGRIEEAVQIFLGQDNRDALTGLILQHAPTLIAQGRSNTLEEWLAPFSREELERIPWLLYWKGVCRAPFNLAEGRSFLEKAFALFGNEGDAVGQFLSWCGIVESITMEWNDFKPLDHWIPLLEELLQRYTAFPSPDIEVRVAVNMLNALLYRKPHYSDLIVWEGRLREVLQRVSENRQRLLIGSSLLLYHLWMGEFAKAALMIEQMQPDAQFKAAEPIAYFSWRNLEALYLWITDDPNNSLALGSRNIEEAHSIGICQFDHLLLCQGAYAMLSMGDVDACRGYLQQMKAVLHPARRLDASHYHYITAWECMLRGDLAHAHEHLSTSLILAEDAGSLFPQSSILVALSHVLIARAEYANARSCIKKAGQIASDMKSATLEVIVLIAEAHLALEQAEDEQCFTTLRNAFAISRERGIINHGWWLPSVMSRLCAKALENNTEVEYVQGLIRKRNLLPDATHPLEEWPYPLKIHTLGRFSVLKDGNPLQSKGKVQKRPMEMLKALIAFGGADVREEKVTDALWLEADGDTARISFKTTLHRLRKMLGGGNEEPSDHSGNRGDGPVSGDEAIQYHEGRLSLDKRYFWVDVWAFERLLHEAEKSGISEAEKMRLLDKAVALYKGPFLPDDADKTWVVSFQELLKGKFLNAVRSLGAWAERGGDFVQAISYYQRGLDADELAEEFYCALMRCYREDGNKVEAIRTYQRCQETIGSVLGVKPSRETEKVYATIIGA